MQQEPEYDRKLILGNTTVYIVAPKISEEENQRRIKELENTIERLFGHPVSITREEGTQRERACNKNKAAQSKPVYRRRQRNELAGTAAVV
jgi:hypothetical protein